MIYTDLEKIYKTRNIENKYALAMIVSMRARQLSEQKGRALDGGGSELFITHALGEVARGDLKVSKRSTLGPVVADEMAETEAPAAAPETLAVSETGEPAGIEEHTEPGEEMKEAGSALLGDPVSSDHEKLPAVTAADADEGAEEAASEDDTAVGE